MLLHDTVVEEPIPSRINLDNQLQTIFVIKLLHLKSLHHIIFFFPHKANSSDFLKDENEVSIMLEKCQGFYSVMLCYCCNCLPTVSELFHLDCGTL